MSNETALARVDDARKRGALVYVNPEHYQAQVALYKTEVTELCLKKDDFHVISGKFMPKKETVDKISEACGVTFIQAYSRSRAEIRDDVLAGKRTAYIAEEQGKVRMPDGSYRESPVEEYEFDPVLRAMIDKKATEITPQNRADVMRMAMDYTKTARQRAKTGARVRVIRQLTGMPTAFDGKDLGIDPNGNIRPMVFTRVVQNTDYILRTPEGRAMATAQALVVDISTLFGGRKLPSPVETQTEGPTVYEADHDLLPETPAADPAQEAECTVAGEPEFPGPAAQSAAAQEESEFERLTHILDEIMMSYKPELDVATKAGSNPYKMAYEELRNLAASEETRKDMINRLLKYLRMKGVNV